MSEDGTYNHQKNVCDDQIIHRKPKLSIPQLIVEALSSAENKKLTLNEIYLFINKRYPYYSMEKTGWKNAIRHNLSIYKNNYFLKVPRARGEAGKGNYWRACPDYLLKLHYKSLSASLKHTDGSVDNMPSSSSVHTSCQFHDKQLACRENSCDKVKPSFSFVQLIVQAISSVEDKRLTSSGIYSYISKHHPYYSPREEGWKSSVRQILSMNELFINVPRTKDDPYGEGNYWMIEPFAQVQFVNEILIPNSKTCSVRPPVHNRSSETPTSDKAPGENRPSEHSERRELKDRFSQPSQDEHQSHVERQVSPLNQTYSNIAADFQAQLDEDLDNIQGYYNPRDQTFTVIGEPPMSVTKYIAT